MLCPTCSCDLANFSFVNSLSHVTNCIDANGKKVRRNTRSKKRSQSYDWYQTINEKPPDSEKSIEPKLVVTNKGYIYQAHDLLTRKQVEIRVDKIFKSTIPKNTTVIANAKEHVPLELSVRKNESFTARGFEQYITQGQSVDSLEKMLSSQKKSYDSPGGGFLLEDSIL